MSSKNHLYNPRSQIYVTFSFTSFVLWGFILRSAIHFELIILYDVKERSMLITLYHIAIWTFLSQLNFLNIFVINQLIKYVSYISRLPVLFVWSLCLSFYQYQTVSFDEAWLLKSGKINPPMFFFFLIVLVILGILHFHINFEFIWIYIEFPYIF